MELHEAAKDIDEHVTATWETATLDRLYIAVGKAGGAWIEEKNGRVVLQLDKQNKQHDPVELSLTYDVELDAWVGEDDQDIAPTPGRKIPRVPGGVVVARAIAGSFVK